MAFSPDELERYARHIVLREIGGPGQAKLKAARVAVVGAGGLGCPALVYLAAAGCGHITVIDDDTVSLSNLQRQVLFAPEDIGAPKAERAAAALSRLNPEITVRAAPVRLDATRGRELLAEHDLVLDGTDGFTTRYLINDLTVGARQPLLSAAMTQWEGQISIYAPHLGHPCYACVFPEAPAAGLAPTCAEAGIVGALAGVMGTMMAVEAVKWITGAGESLAGTLLLYDALYADVRRVRVARDPSCPVCGAA
ncbi:MAG: molybdopterin-synthase adenylyltransferase MoeB [Pseudomonadota bacterium]